VVRTDDYSHGSYLRNTRVEFVPPKPNEFDMATLILWLLAVFGT